MEAESAEDVPTRYRKGLRGVVRNVEKREIQSKHAAQPQEEYLGFRLERNDQTGNVVEVVPVETTAVAVLGRNIQDGDNVIVLGRRDRHGLLRSHAIWNLTTRAEIRGRSPGCFAALLSGLMAVPVTMAAMGFLIGILLLFSNPPVGVLVMVGSAVVLAILGHAARKLAGR